MQPALKLKVGAVIVASTATLTAGVVGFEGMEFTPYPDTGGIWTVCGGVTGPHVIRGKIYTAKECWDLTTGAIAKHGAGVRACIGDQHLTQARYEAFTSLAYNVGVGAVCNGSIPRLLREGKHGEACARILMYDKVRINGVLQSCKDPRWNCRGVWVRRQAEERWCNGTPPPPVSLGVAA